jgi:hypothetical protein
VEQSADGGSASIAELIRERFLAELGESEAWGEAVADRLRRLFGDEQAMREQRLIELYQQVAEDRG